MGCWLGLALSGEPSLNWMVQTIVWMHVMLPSAVLFEHANLKRAGGVLGVWAVLGYAIGCYVVPWLVATPFAIVFKRADLSMPPTFAAFVHVDTSPLSAEWFAAIFSARECPLTRLPMLLLTCRATLAVKAGWRPSRPFASAALGGAAICWLVDVLPYPSSLAALQLGRLDGGGGPYKLWRGAEYVAQPFQALAIPILISWHEDSQPRLSRLAARAPVRLLAKLSTYGLSYYTWQSTSIWLVASAFHTDWHWCHSALNTLERYVQLPAQVGLNAAFAVISLKLIEEPSNEALKRLIERLVPEAAAAAASERRAKVGAPHLPSEPGGKAGVLL